MKTLIECLRGSTTQTVNGSTYSFERDQYSRFVANVSKISDREVFLSIEHYKAVPEHPTVEEIPDGFTVGLGGEQPNDGEQSEVPPAPLSVKKTTAKSRTTKAK